MKNKCLALLFGISSIFTFNASVKAESNKLYDIIQDKADKTTKINFSVNSSDSTNPTNGIYTTDETDSGKEVYYYRGSYTELNNNLIFNNMCWKIIRTTESGGVKLIYNGTPIDGQCSTQTGDTTTQLENKKEFNKEYNDNAYVGYMYGTVGSDTYEATHANINDSTIKSYIDNWYITYFDTTATSKIEDTVYCNDRSMVEAGDNNTISNSSYGTTGIKTMQTGYGSLARSSQYTISPNPTLKCVNDNDKFTVNSANGNGKLTYPVGLITLDEVIFAGYNSFDNNNYLNNLSSFWTMTPVDYNQYSSPRVGCVIGFGIGSCSANGQNGVRPVISLNSGTRVSGTGSTTDPYVVSLYKVDFVTNISTDVPSVDIFDDSTKVSEPTELTKDGYTLIGWYTDSEFTNKFDFDSVITDDITLYAKWYKNYTYKFILGTDNEIGEEKTYTASKVNSYTFSIDGDYNLFESLTVNDVALEKDKDYTVKEGSTIITFTDDGLSRLNTLNKGTYSVVIKYTNNKEVVGKLNILEDKTISEDNKNNESTSNDHESNPKTYDGIKLWILISFLSIIALIELVIISYENKNNI